MADVDPALGEEILDVAQRRRYCTYIPPRQTNDLGRADERVERLLTA